MDSCPTSTGAPCASSWVQRVLHPFLWTPDGSSVDGWQGPDFSQDSPRWTAFLIFLALLLVWLAYLPKNASLAAPSP